MSLVAEKIAKRLNVTPESLDVGAVHQAWVACHNRTTDLYDAFANVGQIVDNVGAESVTALTWVYLFLTDSL